MMMMMMMAPFKWAFAWDGLDEGEIFLWLFVV